MATLILTVGGSHQPILASLQHNHPENVVFLCSDDKDKSPGSYTQVTGPGLVLKSRFDLEKPDLPNIAVQANLAPDRFTVVRIENYDDLNACYLAAVQAIEQARLAHPNRIIIDYTGGTKSMTAGLAAAALDDGQCEISLVVGRRTDLIKVQDRSEYVRPLRVWDAQMQRRLRAAQSLLERFDYRGAEQILREAVARFASEATIRQVENGLALCRGFDAWDRFDHVVARQALEPLAGSFVSHYRILKVLAGEARGHEFELVEDLLLNAQRRHLQGRHDDAVGRLYRALELTAQVWLKHRHGIATGDVSLDKVPESSRDKLARFRDSEKADAPIQIALLQSWDLITDFPEDPLGKLFKEHRGYLVNFLSVRNNSLFAHGFTPIRQADYNHHAERVSAFLNRCVELAVPAKQRSVILPQFPTQLPGQP